MVERVSEQIVENDKRRKITEAQRARGIQQLLDAGVPVTRIAKKLSVKKDTVKAAETVGKSDVAKAALDTGQLSLSEAAALTEFESLPGALDRLTSAAGTGRFDHVVAQLREEQVSWQAQIKAEDHWREKGFAILDDQPRWDAACVELRYLRTAEGESVDEAVVTDPAQWAVLVQEEEAWVDAETGEVVDEATIDWETENNPEATPVEGMRHFNTIEEGTRMCRRSTASTTAQPDSPSTRGLAVTPGSAPSPPTRTGTRSTSTVTTTPKHRRPCAGPGRGSRGPAAGTSKGDRAQPPW